ncbi:hypothetical protein EJB05_02925 [Eragrostis curvula]|uniref:Cyclin-like domain-containing protein n=1 Tax=Eragrostis curvula TaxID=38414 RepID=A0A5J9WTT7_9POAL|nr:hypothetical protein EJB05_02925 [Eragrostis curvula]
MDDWYTDSDSESANVRDDGYMDQTVFDVIDSFQNFTIAGRDGFINTRAQLSVDSGSDIAADDDYMSGTDYDQDQAGDTVVIPLPEMEAEVDPGADMEVQMEGGVETEAEERVPHQQQQTTLSVENINPQGGGPATENVQDADDAYWPFQDLPNLAVSDVINQPNVQNAPQGGIAQALSQIEYEGAVHDGDNLRCACQALNMTAFAASAAQKVFDKIGYLQIRKSPRVAASAAIYFVSLLTTAPKCPYAISFVTGVAVEDISQCYAAIYPHADEIISEEDRSALRKGEQGSFN